VTSTRRIQSCPSLSRPSTQWRMVFTICIKMCVAGMLWVSVLTSSRSTAHSLRYHTHVVFLFNDPLLATHGISDSKQGIVLRSALQWVTTQRTMIIPYGRFGTTYRSHFQGLEDGTGMTLEDGTGRLSRNVGVELTLYAA